MRQIIWRKSLVVSLKFVENQAKCLVVSNLLTTFADEYET